MEIKELAKSILFSSNLADKLHCDDVLIDKNPLYHDEIPKYPERPPELSIRKSSYESQKHFPSRASLSSPIARGHVLHFFANHELLALEIMALVLLKFPKASQDFRIGVARTIREEQGHLKIYINRMRELGVNFGDIPVNGYFWNIFGSIQSPIEFVTKMSLTFEQANLDYARFYEKIFQSVGDETSALIMQKVIEDEIGHVKHGLKWFETWRPNKKSQFEEYQESLAFPLSPARAKGNCFDRESRIKVGFSIDFIDNLEVFSRSKSKPPVAYYFNPEFEFNLLTSQWTEFRKGSKSKIQKLQEDLSSILFVIAKGCDIVITDKKPSNKHLLSLTQRGFILPEFMSLEALKASGRKIQSLNAWGFCTEVNSIQNALASNIQYMRDPKELDASRKTSSKIFSLEIARLLNDKRDPRDPVCCNSIEEINHELNQRFTSSNKSKIVFKSLRSASGRGQLRLSYQEWIKHSEDRKWLPWVKKEIELTGGIVLENWLDRVLDLSTQGETTRGETLVNIGVTRPLCDSRGQYVGHVIGRAFSNLPKKFQSKWHSQWKYEVAKVFEVVGDKLLKEKYYGPFGIDHFVYRENDELHLLNFVELNPRLTMGRIALAISKRMSAQSVGVFCLLPKRALNSKSYEKISEEFPTSARTLKSPNPHRSDFFFLTDPEQAQMTVAMCAIHEDLNILLEKLEIAFPEYNPLKFLQHSDFRV